jgi:hypothetical protein
MAQIRHTQLHDWEAQLYYGCGPISTARYKRGWSTTFWANASITAITTPTFPHPVKEWCVHRSEGSAPSMSPPPLGSPSEISSRCPHSLVFEQGGPSGNIPVIDLSSSSNEEDFFVDTS